MKNAIIKMVSPLFFISLCFMLTTGCGESNAKNEKEAIGTATFLLEDGTEIDFNATFNSSLSLQNRKLSVGLSNSLNGMLVYIMIMAPEPLTVGEQSGYISLKQIVKKDIIQEDYNSHYFKDKITGKTGNSTFTITSLEENRVSGIFSGTLYSSSGNKIEVRNGNFNIMRE